MSDFFGVFACETEVGLGLLCKSQCGCEVFLQLDVAFGASELSGLVLGSPPRTKEDTGAVDGVGPDLELKFFGKSRERMEAWLGLGIGLERLNKLRSLGWVK